VYRVASKDPCAHPRWHALKIASDMDNNKHAVTKVPREASALNKLAGHCGVPRLWQLVGQGAFSMEYCVGGSLECAMRRAKKQKRLPLAVCMEVFRQLMCTIQRAHKAGLLHRDIKPANILLRHKLTCKSTMNDVDVVLADWGLAIAIGESQSKGGMVGTARYLPPEVLAGEQPFDSTCDVWAAACALAQMLRRDGGAPLFSGKLVPDWVEQLKTLLNAEIPCDDVRNLLLAVLSSARSEGPDASKVLQMLSAIVLQAE